MSRKRNPESERNLTRLEELIHQAERRIKRTRDRVREVSGHLAEGERSPGPGKKDQ